MSMFLFIFNSPQEWILVILVVFLLFGATRLPQLAKSLGQTRKAFKDGMREAEEEEQAEALRRQQLSSNPDAPQITPVVAKMSDEELMAEMKRRVEAKNVSGA